MIARTLPVTARMIVPAALLLTLAAAPAPQAQTAKSAPQPKTASAESWKKIPIPPLHAFKPREPKRIVLDNGLVIFLQEDHELPFVNGSISMRGGTRDEDKAKAGLVDLYGETWRTSGTSARNGDQLDDLLEARAAKVETGGDDDSTSLSWSCLKGDLDLVYGIAIDLLEHPAFDPQKLRLAQQQAAAAIVRRNDNASGIASREAAKLVYGKDSPYVREPEIATVLSVTVDDLKKWHDRALAPNNMIVGVVGDFDPAAMEQKLRRTFESLPKGPAWPAPPTGLATAPPGVYFVDKEDVNQSNIWIVGPGTERRNPDYFALSVMNEVFSGGFGSRLFQRVRTQLGLAYSVGGGYGASYDHPGMFRVVAATKSETTVEATQELLRQIGNLKTLPFTAQEVQAAKDQMLNSFIFTLDTPEKVLAERTRLEFYGYPADFLEKYRAGIEKVTVADLERVARQYIDPSKLAILVVGNSKELKPPLTRLGSVQPVDITIPMPEGMGAPPHGKGR